MRVDRLLIEVVQDDHGYRVHAYGNDQELKRSFDLEKFTELAFTEMLEVVQQTADTFRPGTQMWMVPEGISYQPALFDRGL